LLPWSPLLRRAIKRTALLLATNRETYQLMKRIGGQDVRHAFDNAVAERMLLDQMPRRSPDGEIKVLWAGRLEPLKALRLGIEALALVKGLPISLVVAGSGSQRSNLEHFARDLGVSDRVQFLGQVPWVGMTALFQSADAFLFTSLRDSMGSVVLEAMAQGLPIVTLNHQGVATLVPEEAGIKVPVTTPAETAAALGRALGELVRSPESRQRMAEASWNYARAQTWERRVAEMGSWYEECVKRRQAKDVKSRYAVQSNWGKS
jgi:glycosyltransferase involved in cell wall biosynthesis